MLELIKNPAAMQEGEPTPKISETPTEAVVIEQLYDEFSQRLSIIHNECNAAEIGKHTARDSKYMSYIHLFLWWLDVQQHPGMWRYFERRISTGRRPSANVVAGINFSSLVRLGFARYLAVDSNFCARANDLLNALNNEMLRNPAKYQNDTAAKLLLFLNTQKWGGKAKKSSSKALATGSEAVDQTDSASAQAANAPSEASTTATQKPKKSVGFTQKNRVEHLLRIAKAFFVLTAEGNRINLDEPLLPEIQPNVTSEDQSRHPHPLAVVLVAQNSNGQFVLQADPLDESREDHAALARNALVNSFRASFLPLPKSIRAIAETIRSQMLLPNMAKIESKLTEDTDMISRWHKGFAKAKQRLIYIKESKQFLLSPISTKLGMVTLSTPKDQVVEEPASDLMLLKRSISRMERAMRTNDLSMYTVEHQDMIPCTGTHESPRNGMWLTSRTNNEHRILLDFYTVLAWASFNHAQVNANWETLQQGQHWKLKPYVFKQLHQSAVFEWLTSYGDNITRDRNAFVKLELTDNQITIHFDKTGLNYQRNFSFEFAEAQNIGMRFVAEFRAKWLMAAIDGISAVTHSSDIDLFCTADGILFDYETSAATFKVAVPTYGHSATSTNPCFLSYTPCELQPESLFPHSLADDAEVYADAQNESSN